MASIAAITTGVGGVITTADNSGDLNLQSGTTTIVSITSAGAAVTGTLSASGATTFPAGSAAAPAITTTGDTNTGIFFPAADTIAFAEGGVESMRIDSSGNLGLGVTPSANAGSRTLSIANQTGGFSALTMGSNFTQAGYIGYNMGNTGTNSTWKYISADTGSALWFNGNEFRFMQFASGSAGATTSGTQAMTLNASGNLGIGTSSPTARLDVQVTSGGAASTKYAYGFGNTNYNIRLASALGTINGYVSNLSGETEITYGSYYYGGGLSYSEDTTASAIGVNAGYIRFSTNSGLTAGGTFSPAERMRIDNTGCVLLNGTSPLYQTAGCINSFISSAVQFNYLSRNTGATAGQYWGMGANSANAFVVYNQSNTGVYIVNGGTAWVANSDERLKADLIPIENASEKVSTLRAVTGRYTNDEEGVSRAFLIAQDVQAVLPEAVTVQDDELGTLGVAYTDIIPLLVAAIKELKAEIDLLKGAK